MFYYIILFLFIFILFLCYLIIFIQLYLLNCVILILKNIKYQFNTKYLNIHIMLN